MRTIIASIITVIAGLVLLGFASLVNAGAEINQSAANGQYIHAPYDIDNNDNELYIGSIGETVNVQRDGLQSILYQTEIIIPTLFAPDVLADLRQGKIHLVYPTQGQQCTITDVNGDARQTSRWSVVFRAIKNTKAHRRQSLDVKRFRVSIRCSW